MVNPKTASVAMTKDIRDIPYLNHEDILELNFIKKPGNYFYRRHFRFGLRSHIMEVLLPKALEIEKKGIIIDGLRLYPRAKPIKMLRIFRTRFDSLKSAREESKRVQVIVAYLAPDNIARSDEFLVDYAINGKLELILCGLQEYVDGEILDPWGYLDEQHLVALFKQMDFEGVANSEITTANWIQSIRKRTASFVKKIKAMIIKENYIPDLAGIGNLILTPYGEIKLVDINNISKVYFNSKIGLDDRGYPVCDKSIEALALFEQKVLGRSINKEEVVYKTFLDARRMKAVRAIEKAFHDSMQHGKSMAPLSG
jgi:hypothetical protein